MDSFIGPSGFRYGPNSSAGIANGHDDDRFSAALEIYVHHARNIHNICIYENQDVYAKFSLTYNPDETISTRIINGGGKNPDFNESLLMEVTQLDAVLKCEIWMLSRARNFLEDQLLGFALVPISLVNGKGKITQDFSLSSTDLFHSPAGTIKLSLSLNTSFPSTQTLANSSITSEVVLLDRKGSDEILDPVEYSRIEFPDMGVVRESQQMVSEIFGSGASARPCLVGAASFLQLGSCPQHPIYDCEMAVNLPEEIRAESGSVSPNESVQNSGFLSSTTTSLSDDRNSADSVDKKIRLASAGESPYSLSASKSIEVNPGSGACPDTPTSKKGGGGEGRDEKDANFSAKKEDYSGEEGNGSATNNKLRQAFKTPLGSINNNMDAEQSAMQQHIVDMYMRSMQQFTESLAQMKLPIDLNKSSKAETNGDAIQMQGHDANSELEKKKDGSRVFYGSRAFF